MVTMWFLEILRRLRSKKLLPRSCNVKWAELSTQLAAGFSMKLMVSLNRYYYLDNLSKRMINLFSEGWAFFSKPALMKEFINPTHANAAGILFALGIIG